MFKFVHSLILMYLQEKSQLHVDNEALREVSGERNLPDQQALQAEEVVEREQDRVQPQPGEGDLRDLQIHRQPAAHRRQEVRHAPLRARHLFQATQGLPLQAGLLSVRAGKIRGGQLFALPGSAR